MRGRRAASICFLPALEHSHEAASRLVGSRCALRWRQNELLPWCQLRTWRAATLHSHTYPSARAHATPLAFLPRVFFFLQHSAGGRWQAWICVSGKKHFLGLFDEELEAAHAYDEAARRLRGPTAKCNFLPDGTLCPRPNKSVLPHNITPASLRQASEIVVNYTSAVTTAAEKIEALQHGDFMIMPASAGHVHAHNHAARHQQLQLQLQQQLQQHQQEQQHHHAVDDDGDVPLSSLLGDAIVSPMGERDMHDGGAARMTDHSDAATVLPHHSSHQHAGAGSASMGGGAHYDVEVERRALALRSNEQQHTASSSAATAHLLQPHAHVHTPYGMDAGAGAYVHEHALLSNEHPHY